MKLCMCFLHGMGMSMWLDVIVRLFFSLFPHCELSHISPSIYRQWVPREHNSSYNFILIFLELCTCVFSIVWRCACAFHIILAICLSLFCSFWTVSFTDLRCIDSGYHVIAISHTILNQSFWNFAHAFSRVCRSAHELDMILFLVLSFFPLELCHFLNLRFFSTLWTKSFFTLNI